MMQLEDVDSNDDATGEWVQVEDDDENSEP